jgi:tetratricopeptide (TPR) repeat protein
MEFSIPSVSERARRVVLAVVLACSGSALAGGGGLAEAKAAVAEAKKAFDLGKFDAALAKYEEAYTLHPAPGLLFNLGQCHRQMGNAERALFFFRRYLESKPTGPQAEATKDLIAKLEVQAAQQQQKSKESEGAARQLELEKARLAAAQAEADAAEKKKAEEAARIAARQAEEEAQRKKALEASLTAPPPPPPVVEEPVTKKWWFWAATGTVAVIATGAAVAIAQNPKPSPTTFPDINAR